MEVVTQETVKSGYWALGGKGDAASCENQSFGIIRGIRTAASCEEQFC